MRVCVAADSVRDVGIGVDWPKTIGLWLTMPLAGTRNKSDSPEIVLPSTIQVARARPWPDFAGTFGKTHEPSELTLTVRFSTLTVQFSFSCALESRAAVSASIASVPIRRRRR